MIIGSNAILKPCTSFPETYTTSSVSLDPSYPNESFLSAFRNWMRVLVFF
ncbi:hypothetical protein [Borreliella garinii]|nr:hypothetical protein [Borreliella garinii]